MLCCRSSHHSYITGNSTSSFLIPFSLPPSGAVGSVANRDIEADTNSRRAPAREEDDLLRRREP